jgi:hypothetical protein
MEDVPSTTERRAVRAPDVRACIIVPGPHEAYICESATYREKAGQRQRPRASSPRSCLDGVLAEGEVRLLLLLLHRLQRLLVLFIRLQFSCA